jgi:anti-anti-sigma factor
LQTGYRLFDTEHHDGVALLLPSGELDAGTVGEYQRWINELPGTEVHYFVISVDGVSFVGIAGLGARVRMYEWVCIGDWDVRLARIPSRVVKTLKIPHLAWVFKAYPVSEETSASLGR